MTRKLVAVLACRAGGTRLYGKPLQNLVPGVTILDQIISALRTFPQVSEIVLAISEGVENLVFQEVAERLSCPRVVGDSDDVLARLIEGASAAEATDVFRVTSECPFFDYSMFDEAWDRHVTRVSDITVLDHVPLGTAFEIYRITALEKSHREGLDADRSELCSNFARYNQRHFELDILKPPPSSRRLDLRITVDYPEDLTLCRAVYEALGEHAPRVPLDRIIDFLDGRPELTGPVARFAYHKPMWDGQPQRG